MSRAFWLRLVSSFIIAGTWKNIAAHLAERLGSLLGGLIANLSSTIVVSMIFMSLVKGEYSAAGVGGIELAGMKN